MDYLEDISYEEFMSDGSESESESSTNLSSSSSMEHVAASDACDNHGNETEHDFDEFDTLDIDTNADNDSDSSYNEAESSSVVPEVNPTNPQTNSIVKDDTCNELKSAQISSPPVELKPLIIATPPQQKPSGLDPRAFSMYPTAEDLSKPDKPQDNNTRERRHQFRHIGGAETSTLSNSINSDKLYEQNVENTKEKLKDLTISESSTTPEASTATKISMDISNPTATDISNPSKSDPKLIELKDARLKLTKNFAETKQLSILSELLQLNDRITFIQGFDDIQSISSPSSSPSPSTEAKPCSSTDKCYKQAESPTSAAIIGNINDMNARYAYEQKILITGVEPHECPYTKILRRKTAAETHQEILEQFLKYAKIENPLIESKKAKESCKDLFNSMPETIKKSSCFSACPFGDYFTGLSVDQVIASLRKPMSLSSRNDTQQPQPTTICSKFSVEPGPCFNISPSKTTTTQTSKDAYERMKECEKMVSMLNDAKSRATTMPKYLQQHFERSIHEAEKNFEVAKNDYEMLCKSSSASSDSTKADMPKEQSVSFIDKLYQNMKNCEKIYEKLKSTEPGFRASHGHNEGLMGHFRNRLKEAESNWINAQIQYNECCAKDKLQKSLGALNSSTAYNEMKKQENLYANLMDAKNFNDGNCDEDKIEKTKLQLEKAKELYEEASRFGQAKSQLNLSSSTPSTLEASSSTAVKSGIEVKSGSQNLHKLDSDVSKMNKVNNQMNIFNSYPTQMFATSNNGIQKIFATPEPGFQASHGHNEGLIGHFQNRETGENERRQLLEAKKRELARLRQARSQQTAAILDQHFANGRPSTVAEKMQNILANVGLDSPDHPPNSLSNGNSSMLNGTINESQNDKIPTISPPRRPNRLVSVEELASKVKSGSQNLHKLDSDVSKMNKVNNQMNIFNSYPTQMFATSNNGIQKIFATPEPGFQASHGHNEGLIGHFQNRETGENERRQLLEAKKRELARLRQARSQQTAAILDQHFANGRPSTVAEKMQNILANVGLDSPDHPPNSLSNGNSSMLNGTINESQNDKIPTISPPRRPNRLVSVEELASKVKSGSQNLHKLDSDVSKTSKVTNQMNIFNPDPTQMFATSSNGIQKSFATTIQQQQQLLTESFKIQLEKNQELLQRMQQRYPPSDFEQSAFSRKDDQKEIKLQLEESEKLFQQLQQSYLASNFDQGVFLLGNSRTNDQILLKKLQAEFRHFQQIFQDTENARKTLIEMNEILQAENQRLRNDGNLMKEEMKKTFKGSEKEFKNALEEKDSKIAKLEAELDQQLLNQLKKDCEEEKMKAKKDAEIAKLLAENLRLTTLLTSSSNRPEKEKTTQTSTQSCSIIPQSQLNIFPTKYVEIFKNVQNDHQQVVELVNNAKTKACEIQAGIEKNGNTSFIGFEIPKTKAELKPLRIQLKKQEYCQSKELPAENKKQLKMNKLEVLQAVKKVQRTKKSNKKPLKTSGSISMEEMMAQLLELQDSCGFNERHPELNGQYEGGKIVQKRNLNQKMPICLSKVFNVAKTVKADNKIEDCQKVFPGLEGLPSEVDGMLLYLRKLQEEVNNEQNSTTASAEPQRQESPAKRQELETFNNQINKDEDDIANAERDIDATLPNDISLLEQINEQQLIPINELITSIDSLPIPNEEMKNCKNAIKNRSKTIKDKLLETLEKRKQNDIISTINDEFAKFKDATQPITSMTFNGTQMEFAKGLKHSVEPLEAVKLNEKKPKESEQNLSAELAKAQQQIEYYQKLAADQAEALKNFNLAKSLEKQLSEATQKADKALKALGKREAMDFVSRDLVLKRFKENDDDHSPVF